MPTSSIKTPAEFPHFGDVFDVKSDAVDGRKTGKRCLALVVSNNVNNEFADSVTVLPITNEAIKKVYSFEVFLPKGTAELTEDSRIKADQVRTIDKKKLVRYRGALPIVLLNQVNAALKVHLNMEVTWTSHGWE